MAFFAVKIPDQYSDLIWKDLEALRRDYPDLEWENRRDFHITVKFFKGWDLDRILAELSSWRSLFEELNLRPFHLQIGGAGVFSSPTRQVYWSVVEMHPSLQKLAQKLDLFFKNRYAQASDFEEFKPHLTLARQTTLQAIPNIDFNFQYRFLVESIVLMKRKQVVRPDSQKFEVIDSFSLVSY